MTTDRLRDEIDAGALLAERSRKALQAGITADEWRRQVGAA